MTGTIDIYHFYYNYDDNPIKTTEAERRSYIKNNRAGLYTAGTGFYFILEDGPQFLL